MYIIFFICFRRALQDIPRHVDQFWEIVSLIVKTRTADECRDYYESRKKDKENKKSANVTGKKVHTKLIMLAECVMLTTRFYRVCLLTKRKNGIILR